MTDRKDVVIVGGGAAGITVAAGMLRKAHGLNLHLSVIEPSTTHCYQPALTLVGAGVTRLDALLRPESDLIPRGVDWDKTEVTRYLPGENCVVLGNGAKLNYDYLIVCPGVKPDWEKIPGARESLGRNGVSSNYSPDHAIDTWDNSRYLKTGATAIFTQPPLPFKCPGAPQKAAYMTADHLKKRGILSQCKLHFMTHAPVIFGVPLFARELVKVAERYGITVHYQHNLVAVDGNSRTATFEVVGGEEQGKKYTLSFDMLHVTPPQSPPDTLKQSPLANGAGYVDVDQGTLQHKKYPNIFSLGDAAATPNSKTAAAVRKQAPVVIDNLIALIRGGQLASIYDGYASCPLTTAYNKVIMAEFCYGGKVTPTFPLDPRRERWINWVIKTTGLPLFYWYYMLKGYRAFPRHNTNYVEPQET